MAHSLQLETFVDLPPVFVQLIHRGENILSIDKGLNSVKIIHLENRKDGLKYIVCPCKHLDDIVNGLKVKGIICDDVRTLIMGDNIQEVANKMSNVTLLSKTDSLIKGFTSLLANSTWEQLVHRPADDVISRANRRLEFSQNAWKSMAANGSNMTLHLDIMDTLHKPYAKILEHGMDKITENEDIFPCLLVYLSSKLIIYKVNKNGSYQELERLKINGMSLEGLATILSEAKNTSECFQYITEGKGINVHSRVVDEINLDSEDVYSKIISTKEQSERLAFCFGRGNDPKKTFEKADLANAWLQTLCHGWQQHVYFHALRHNVKAIFACGRLTNLQFIQDFLTEEFLVKPRFYSISAGKDLSSEIYFMKNSQFIAALGGVTGIIE